MTKTHRIAAIALAATLLTGSVHAMEVHTNNLPSGAAQDGTDASGVTPPSGATGIRGWLSGIYNRLGQVLTFTTAVARGTGTIAAGTLNATYSLALNGGQGTVGFTLTGLTASGATLTAEGSNDGGTTWSPINMIAPSTGSLSTTVTADGGFRVNGSGHTNVRLRVSTIGTGTITVASSASTTNGLMSLSAPLPAFQSPPAVTLNSTPSVPWSGPAVVPTVAASSHAVGTAIGGKLTFSPVARTAWWWWLHLLGHGRVFHRAASLSESSVVHSKFSQFHRDRCSGVLLVVL